MRTACNGFALLGILMTGVFAASSWAADKLTPRYSPRVVCFNGSIDSGSKCDTSANGDGKLRCGFVGRVSEVEWVLMDRRGTNDVYLFSRRYPVDSVSLTKSTTNILFSGSRVVVFQDDQQTIVIE